MHGTVAVPIRRDARTTLRAGIKFVLFSERYAASGTPAHLLVPGGCPQLAFFLEVVALLQLPLADIAAQHRVAMRVRCIGEVLAGHADTAPLSSPAGLGRRRSPSAQCDIQTSTLALV